MKHGFSALISLGIALSACGYAGKDNKTFITPSPKPGPPPSSQRVMPEAADHDHHLFAMNELMRVYNSSLILLTSRDSDDSTLGCVQYKRVKDQKPRSDGSLLFRTATYKACRWEQTFGNQPFSWKIGSVGQEDEIFTISVKELEAKAKLEITAEPLVRLMSESAKPDVSKLGLGNTYWRQVRITRASDAQPGRFPFKAATVIGKKEEATRDHWETQIAGTWLTGGGKIKGELSLDFNFDQAKLTASSKPRSKHLNIRSVGYIAFGDGNCQRPLGVFSWTSVDPQGHIIAGGELEAKSDGLHLSSSEFIAWPKSCLEFPAATGLE